MVRKPRPPVAIPMLAVLASLLSLSAGAVAVRGATGNEFVKQTGPELRLNGKKFRFAGTSNYYLMYKSRLMVDDVLEAASAQGFRVLRMWGSLDIGDPSVPSTSIRGPADGVYFQYWDAAARAPAYNDGADGLQRLDYVIARAGQLGLRLVIPFVNNWNDFGGMDQYVRWRDLSTPDGLSWYHDSFYTDPVIRGWYRDWIAHLLERTNTITGMKYKNDPTIMTWELGNEPRCLSAGAYPRSASCTTETLVEWVDEMSTYVKTIDDEHLVSVGDEGFYCRPGATHWTENCGEGVDTVAFAALENIDVMSFHLYPDSWGTDVAWGTEWIKSHFAAARALDKPAMLGEFGLLDKSLRNPNYKLWADTVLASGGAGALYWILSGKQDDGSLYPDYDGFTVYCPTPVCTTISNFGKQMVVGRALGFPPVADHDVVVTEFETPVTLNPPRNDVAYGGATIAGATLDLDPAAAGRQQTRTVAGGTFTASATGTVDFAPAAGFSGKAEAAYVVADTAGRLSNQATLTVTVKPSPTAPVVIASFETGTEGWAPGSWQTNAGSVSQSTSFPTDGTHSLRVDTADGGWFGVTFATPLDLTGKTKLTYDLRTTGAGTSTNAAVVSGSAFVWCQGSWGFTGADTATTVELDLLDLSCVPELGDVRQIYIWFSGGGAFYLDDVRAE